MIGRISCNIQGMLAFFFLSLISTVFSVDHIFIPANNFRSLRVDCFETLTRDVRRVKIKHGFSRIPDYVRMEAELKIFPKDSNGFWTEFQRVYDLKRIDGDCFTDLFISSRRESFSVMTFQISLFTDYTMKHLMSFIYYTFNENVDHRSMYLWDANDFFAVNVLIGRNPDENITPQQEALIDTIQHAVASVTPNNDHLCVITKNQQRFILKPDYDSGKEPKFHISGIEWGVLFATNLESLETVSLTAFGCGSNEALIPVDVAFIHESPDDAQRALRVMGIYYPYPLYNNYSPPNAKPKITFTDFLLKTTQELASISSKTRKVFLINSRDVELVCLDFSVRHTQVSEADHRLYSYTMGNVELQGKGERRRWIQQPMTSTC